MLETAGPASPVGQSVASDKHVALFIDPSNEYDLGLLNGIRQYAREHPGWSVCISPLRPNPDLSWLARWKGSGIVARIDSEPLAKAVARLNLPTVALNAAEEVPALPFLATREMLAAHMAADYLLKRNIRSFAAFGETRRGVSDHFRACAADRDCPCGSFSPAGAGKSEIEKKMRIVRWLDELPKPVGILACSHEALLMEACQLGGYRIPADVAVIGFAQGDLLCEWIDPQMSAVIASPASTGYCAAALLDAMMSERPEETAVAESAADEDKLIREALDFIHAHACSGITVMDLLERIPLSRRMLEHRFRKVLGRTPHEEIMATRLKRVKQLLAETDLTLIAIAERSGFKHTEYLSVAFKREVGLSPSGYRKLHRLKKQAAERELLQAQARG
jgi:LacI family transcriptional regulator